MSGLNEYTVHTPDGAATVRYVDLPGAGIPVVFVHGLGGASTLDYEAAATLPRLSGHRRLLIDLLGSGRSDHTSGVNYALADHVDYLDAMFDDLGIDKAILFAHSMAGGIVIPLAARRADHVDAVVLSETNLDGGGGDTSRLIAAQTEAEFVAHGFDALLDDVKAEGSPWARTLALSDPRAIHREAVGLVEGADPSWREILYRLDCPRCYIFGGLTLPDPDYDELPRRGVQTVVVPDAGHNLAYENSVGLADAIAAFLDNHGVD